MNNVETQLQHALAERFGSAVDVPADLPGLDSLLRMVEQSSQRRWADTAVPPELTRLLAACALCAPTKSYLQQADIVDVRDPAQRAALTALGFTHSPAGHTGTD